MHIRVERAVPARELVPGDDAVRYRFSADEYLPHGQILAPGTDSSAPCCRETEFQQRNIEKRPAGIPFRGSFGQRSTSVLLASK